MSVEQTCAVSHMSLSVTLSHTSWWQQAAAGHWFALWAQGTGVKGNSATIWRHMWGTHNNRWDYSTDTGQARLLLALTGVFTLSFLEVIMNWNAAEYAVLIPPQPTRESGSLLEGRVAVVTKWEGFIKLKHPEAWDLSPSAVQNLE